MEPSYKEINNLQAESLVKAFTKVLSQVQPVEKYKDDKVAHPYLRILDLATALRKKLLRAGIMVIPHDVDYQMESWEFEGRHYSHVFVHRQFTVTNGKESLIFTGLGEGQSCDGTAMSSAQTMALKGWLKTIGLIFGEYDDQEVAGESRPLAQVAQAAENVASYNHRAFNSVLKLIQKTPEQAAEFLSAQMGMTMTPEMVVILPKKKFDMALELLLNGTDLTKRLEESVKKVRSAKAKLPVVPINGQAVTAVLDGEHNDEVGAD